MIASLGLSRPGCYDMMSGEPGRQELACPVPCGGGQAHADVSRDSCTGRGAGGLLEEVYSELRRRRDREWDPHFRDLGHRAWSGSVGKPPRCDDTSFSAIAGGRSQLLLWAGPALTATVQPSLGQHGPSPRLGPPPLSGARDAPGAAPAARPGPNAACAPECRLCPDTPKRPRRMAQSTRRRWGSGGSTPRRSASRTAARSCLWAACWAHFLLPSFRWGIHGRSWDCRCAGRSLQVRIISGLLAVDLP